ncbi:hypothetical protein FJT64_025319 [Amphibalanus amphitrite]|uniref:Uncharacterized protein n=1 Tax=Amphibalanus amphitrite TaxID=1232801 RepID=A0A6A4W3W6_AMPAM|nr:hypothetical protein FJT64_025319 [Amphibalanus amphitrite]
MAGAGSAARTGAVLFVTVVVVVMARAETAERGKVSETPRGARELPSAEQLAEIRRVVELVRESRDHLSPAKLAQLARQLRQLRARIDAARSEESEQGGDSESSDSASGVHQVRSLSGGFNNDIAAHTLDAKGTLFYDDIRKGVIEAPPVKGKGKDGSKGKGGSDGKDADVNYGDEDYNFDFSDDHQDGGGVSIAVGVSGGLHAFDGKTRTSSVRHEGGKRVIGVGTSYPVPHDIHSYGTPKPRGGVGSTLEAHPQTSESSSHAGKGHETDFGDARHITGPSGGAVVGFGPPKGAVSGDVFADSTTTRSFLDHSHQTRGQLFHENYIRSGLQSAVLPPGDPRAPTVHLAPAVTPHSATIVQAPPHAETLVAPPGPAAVSVHIGIGGHEPVVGYTPPAHVSPEEHLSVERPRSGGKIIFPVSGPHHAEVSYVAPPPDVHVTHVEEHVYEEHHEPAHVATEYHQPQHVEEHHETHSYSTESHPYSTDSHSHPKDSHSHSKEGYGGSYEKPHDASQYGPPHIKAVPVPYVPQHIPHAQPVYITHHKKRPGLLDNLLRPFRRLKNYLFGGGRGHAKPIPYSAVETPQHNYYEYGAALTTYPKKCRCIDNKNVLGVLVAGVAAAGLIAYVYALATNNTNGFGRAVESSERAVLARLMLQEACSLGTDAEGMWNGTVWVGEGEGEEDGEGEEGEEGKSPGAGETNELPLMTLSDMKRSKLKLLEQDMQTLGPRVARQLREPAASEHQIVKKAGAEGSTSSGTNQQRKRRSAAFADQDSQASGSVHMYSFDGMDIPMRHSPRDPGLAVVPPEPRRPVFRPPPPRPFTPDLPQEYSNQYEVHASGTTDGFFKQDLPQDHSPYRTHGLGESDTFFNHGLPKDHNPFGTQGSEGSDAFFNPGVLDGLDAFDDPLGFNYRLSRRMDMVDDLTAPSDIDRSDSGPSLPLVGSESDSSSSGNITESSSNVSSAAVKATRDLPGAGDLLSTAAALLPMVDLGPFQPLTKVFQADPMEDRSSSKGGSRASSYRKRMKNMFKGLRHFVTKGVPSMMRRTAYDPHCGCIPLTLQNVGLVGAPIFAIIASGLVLTFLVMQSTNQGTGRKRSEDGAVSDTDRLASALETLITAEEAAPDNTTDGTLLKKYYRQIVTPALAIHSGEPLDIGVPLISLPVSWVLTSTQGGAFGQYCSSAVLGGSGAGSCQRLYPGCGDV